MKLRAGTLWVHVKPVGDSIPYGFDEDMQVWIACDGAYGVFNYLYTIKEREEAIKYFDVELERLLNAGAKDGRIELPPRLGGFVFTFSTEYEGDSEQTGPDTRKKP